MGNMDTFSICSGLIKEVMTKKMRGVIQSLIIASLNCFPGTNAYTIHFNHLMYSTWDLRIRGKITSF